MNSRNTSWQTRSVDETVQRGAALGRGLKPGMCIALVGELGSGKTVFVKGIGRGLGISNRNEVKSPSFVLFHIYHGRIPLYHFDFYRLDAGSDLERIGIYEFLFDPNAVSVIEWANRLPEALRSADMRIHFSIHGKTSRRIRVSPTTFLRR